MEKDVAANPQCLRFGAVFPDILFFLAGKSPTARLSSLAYALHGANGEDTYSFLRSLMAETATASEPGPLTAFWVGVASHLHTDIVFHPLVYYLTGNYHDTNPAARTTAVQRHRRFETLLDMYFNRDGEGRQARRHSLRAVLNRLEIPLPRLLNITARSLARISTEKPGDIEKAISKALAGFVTLQDFCCRPLAGRILFSIEKHLPNTVREVTAIFQASRLALHFSHLSEPMRYLNPVSGKAGETTVDELFMLAARECADFCTKMEVALVERSQAALLEQGPSLSYALPGVTVKDGRFFAPKAFLDE